MKLRNLLLLVACLVTSGLSAQKQYTLVSPDKKVETTITAGEQLTYNLTVDGREVMRPSALGMKLTNGKAWGVKPRVSKVSRRSVDEQVKSLFYRSEEIRDHYNSIQIQFSGKWAVEFRAYNEGVAYRFVNRDARPFEIQNEVVSYQFDPQSEATLSYVNSRKEAPIHKQFANSFENYYNTQSIASSSATKLAFLPIIVKVGQGVTLGITESDLNNYPGMYLLQDNGYFKGVFAPYPKELKQGGHNQLEMKVVQQEDFIAKVDGKRNFPWRILTVARADKELAANNLSYLLGAPSRLEDTSWIKPGKVAWDWWNDWNLKGVDFKAGINTQTYKYYIDFASKRGIEYVILDEGWAVNLQADLMQVIPEIDLKEIVDYGKTKNVGIILWAGFHAFSRDMENVCRHYSEMGVKGFKVDFMNRDDQLMTDFNHRAAEMAAKYHLVLDLHGSHKPAGINRTWPNVLNVEGVAGLEQMKWAPNTVDQILYDTQIPFIRQLSGPMDYTQGAMRNAIKRNYYPCYSQPMSQGTRCHQLALYMVLDSPFNMLCDSPTNYEAEEECTDFIASVPTAWDETKILSGEVGKYIVTARRKGNTWYVGGITNWTARSLTVDLSFLGEGHYQSVLFRDGCNADRNAEDYVREKLTLKANQPLKVELAPGGGFSLMIDVK